MKKRTSAPFPFADFERIQASLSQALEEGDEIYQLLTGDTGTGKTALLRTLRGTLDRCRYRAIYFAHAKRLGATGLVRVLCQHLRLPIRRSHPETVRELTSHLVAEPTQLLLWFDEAQALPEETLHEARSIAESDLEGARPVRVLFAGLPSLRERLQATAPLWRRVEVREEITGLSLDEMQPFLEHHFGAGAAKRLDDDGLGILFERGRGVPGLLIPMFRTVLRRSPGKGRIDTLALEDILQRWDLA